MKKNSVFCKLDVTKVVFLHSIIHKLFLRVYLYRNRKYRLTILNYINQHGFNQSNRRTR